MTDTRAGTPRIDVPAAGRYTLDPLRSSVTLRTRLFGLHTLTANMHIAHGQIDVDPAVPRTTVAVAIAVASYTTDNPRRDRDIRSPRFLHAARYPEIGYRAGSLSEDKDRWRLTGELTVRNVTRQVTLEIDSVQRTDSGFRAQASTSVNRAAFGLTHAQWMGGRSYDIELIVFADAL